MNLLILGNGKGSWTMRGQQLGAALGARVTSTPTAADAAWADVIVLVKRAILQFGRLARRSGKPVVWDALDCWAQPAQNGIAHTVAVDLVKAQAEHAQPDLIIGATKAMAASIGGVYLSHHSWAGLVPTPARERVQVVAYQGGEVFLGQWRGHLERLCKARGWRFVINPSDLSAADLIVSFRDGPWDGWICREWKSGVKAVNAIAAGRPFICQPCASADEIFPPGVLGVRTADRLDAAFEMCAPLPYRASVVEHCRAAAPAYTVDAIARDYHTILQSVGVACAAN